MNTHTRAHRILKAMENYREHSPGSDWPAGFAGGNLGECIGFYQNPGTDGEVIGIFSDGVAWHGNGRLIELPFADLAEVTLLVGKESEGLRIVMRDGRQEVLPVRGRRGRFFDSLEMLRFFDRLLPD